MKYKLYKNPIENTVTSITRVNNGGKIWSIPFDPANTDYQQFKNDILEGAELQDADGNVMTPDEAMAFISNLP